MTFELVKSERTEVDIDFDALYEAVKNDFGRSKDEYEWVSEYNNEICEFFETNETAFLFDVFGLNFNDEDSQCYDIEQNAYVLGVICDEFNNFVWTNKNK